MKSSSLLNNSKTSQYLLKRKINLWIKHNSSNGLTLIIIVFTDPQFLCKLKTVETVNGGRLCRLNTSL